MACSPASAPAAAEERVVSAAALVLSVALLVWIAVEVPWTTTAVAAWLLTVPVFVASAIAPMPFPLRVGVAVLVVAWAVILVFPGRSPIGPLSRAEWACQRGIKAISVGARAAYQAGAFGDRQADFVDQLEALEPPNEVWRAVKAAQRLDLSADPPQVGVGDATNRLVTWPWRDALDHRVLRIRIRIDDAIRARKMRHVRRPGFDDMTSSMRYDYFFLRTVWARYDDLKSREGGLLRWHLDVTALADLTGIVRPPDERWARLRDLTIEIIGLELKAATAGLSTIEEERLASAGDEFRERWAELSARDARGLAPASGDWESTTRR